jgi:hypothetical protein
MIPSLDELRKSLVPELATVSDSNQNLQSSTESGRSVNLSWSEFPVVCQLSPVFTRRGGIQCRICLEWPEPAVILRPKYEKAHPSQIARSSLAGRLKHDFVFFGESYLCESCAKEGGFI